MTSPAPSTPPRPWGAPFERLDHAWTAVEQYLAVAVILAEIVTLCGWIALKGLAITYVPGGNVVGVLFRAIVGAVALGLLAHWAVRPKKGAAPRAWHPVVVIAACVLGASVAKLWANALSLYASNWVDWLQNASAVALVGGPRGLVTRLTLWLALLGGSMAASKGKHINIDLATRYIPARLAPAVAIVGWVAAALVCFTAAYGFVDSIAVTKFRAEAFKSCGEGICETQVSERWSTAAEGVSDDLFLLRRQLTLDARSLPHLLSGRRYDQYLTAAAWNEWLDDADWAAHFPPESVAAIRADASDTAVRKSPVVVAPDTGAGVGLLIRDLDFVLPFGLLMVGLKFLLRVVRTLSGHVRVDPAAAHDDEDLKVGHGPQAPVPEDEPEGARA